MLYLNNMEKVIYKEEDLLAITLETNNMDTIINTLGWEIYIFKDEAWELLETKEGNLPEVLSYMYDLETENLGIKINNQINQFS